MDAERNDTFGGMLRGLREAAGLTQEELAARAGLTAKGVSSLERGERKRPYPHTVRSLADALGLPEGERTALLATVPRRRTEKSGPRADAPLVTDPPEPGLPAPTTPLVGRERELGEVTDLLGRPGTRLLTLTGVGGTGKTRLALEAARWMEQGAEQTFPDGVAFAALAPLGDAALVASAISQALGLQETAARSPLDAVREHLRARKILLVLDNFEHVAGAAPDAVTLIEGCPGLTVLVTSRAPLRVRGKQEYPVQPLALPTSTVSSSPEDVLDSPSGRLFVERARAASPTFEATEENAGSVAAICWRLDGLPLALELAAARVRFLDPASLVSRLDQALSAGWARDLPERQRTMQAALDWSYDLLSEEEKILFRRLSVFAGGFTLEAAEAVGAADDLGAGDALGLLGTLVEQSLVIVEPDAGPRFRALEPVRQYALEKLRESGEERDVRGLHAGHYLALMEEAGPGLKGPDQGPWVRRLTIELDNIRAALEWATKDGWAERVAESSWDSWTFWWSSGNISEGRRRMEDAAAQPNLPDLPRAKLRFVAATLGQALGDFEATWPMNEESRKVFERAGYKRGVADAYGTGGLIALGLGRPEEGLDLMQKAVELDLEVGNKWGAAAMLGFSAAVPFIRGDLARARGFAERGLALARKIGAGDVLYVNLHPLATIALAEGDHEQARRLFEEGATLSLEVGEKVNAAFCLEGLAAIAAAGGDAERAARLWGASEAILEDIEVISYPFSPDPSLRERRVAEARTLLGGQPWMRAWADGRAMTPGEAVAYALQTGEMS